MKAQSLYFKSINSRKIESDFVFLKGNLSIEIPYTPSDYFEALSSNIDFAKCQRDMCEICLKYVSLSFLLENKDFVNAFSSLIKSEILKNPQYFSLLINQYDDASFRNNYYFPKFNDDEINNLIEGYLKSKECDLKALELAALHKDSSEIYRIKRKTRLMISQKLKEEQKRLLSDENVISIPMHHDYGFIVSIDQKDLLTVKTENDQTIFSFSKAFFNHADSWEKVLDRLLDRGVLINRYGSINNLYNPFKENTISKLFEVAHVSQYGSQVYQSKNGLNQTLFDFLYSNFAHISKNFENLAVWIIIDKINPLLDGSKLNLTFAKDDNFQIKCEHLFNQIASLLLQYRIFVEEGEITLTLIEETKDSLQIRDLPSLIKDKYYDLNPNSNDSTDIMFLLFNDQSEIRYVSKELNASSFYDLIAKKKVCYDAYKGSAKQKIDYLIDQSILKKMTGF